MPEPVIPQGRGRAPRPITRSRGRGLVLAAGILLAAAGVSAAAGAGGSGGSSGSGAPYAAGVMATTASANPLVREGSTLFSSSCSACHGPDAKGIRGRGPSLIGVGAASVDFMLSTGRMPLAEPGVQASRSDPAFDRQQIRALTAYVTSLSPEPGPAIPQVDISKGNTALGRELFADRCSGCHQSLGEGGIGIGFQAPSLANATPTQIGEAVRTGPYVMPRFSERQLDQHELDSIARFVTTSARHPKDEGGLGIGHIGPIPEGLVAILLGGLAIFGLTRWIGEGRR